MESNNEEETPLSHKAELFRSKLIEEFQILESTSEQGKKKVPVYSTNDIINPELMGKVLCEAPEQMIKFKAYKRGQIRKNNINDLRLTRVSNQKRLPYGVWANLVVESSIFRHTLLFITVISSITIGVQGELPDSNSPILRTVNMVFYSIDSLVVLLFSTEIILKWMDDFRNFWRNMWNIFDLFITFLSVTSTVLLLFSDEGTSSLAITAKQLSVLRILRVVKIITKLNRLRIVILTVLQTFQSLIFITILFLILSYIFAIVGVILFQSYTNSSRDDLIFHKCFRTLPDAWITLFRLFTLDQWFNIYRDITKVTNPAITLIYILLWIGIGSFIFRNLFIGIMVNNFQTLSAELVRKKEDLGKSVELDNMKRELSLAILNHNERLKKVNKEPTNRDINEKDNLSRGWDETVQRNLEALSSNSTETLWPRDTLFRYYQIMEQLHDNLDEYDRLQVLSAEYLLKFQSPD